MVAPKEPTRPEFSREVWWLTKLRDHLVRRQPQIWHSACWGPVGGHRGPMHTYCSQGPWS